MFWNTFYTLCCKRGKSPNGVAKDLGISSGSITSWKQGKVPHHRTLLKLANYFNVTTDYLLGNTDRPAIEEQRANDEPLTEQEKTLLRMFRETSEEGRFEIIAAVVNIAKNKEKNAPPKNTSRAG